MATFYEKLGISSYSALLFTLLTLPATYSLTNNVQKGIVDANGCPTPKGILIHIIAFMVLSFLTMGNPAEEPLLKVKYSIWGGLLAFFFANPVLYSVTSALTNGATATPNGCPTTVGVIVHGAAYAAALAGLMYLPADKDGSN